MNIGMALSAGILDMCFSRAEVRLWRPSQPSVVSPHSDSRIIRRYESNAEPFQVTSKMRPAVRTRVSGVPILSPWKIVRSSLCSSPAIAMPTSGSECTDMSRSKLQPNSRSNANSSIVNRFLFSYLQLLSCSQDAASTLRLVSTKSFTIPCRETQTLHSLGLRQRRLISLAHSPSL